MTTTEITPAHLSAAARNYWAAKLTLRMLLPDVPLTSLDLMAQTIAEGKAVKPGVSKDDIAAREEGRRAVLTGERPELKNAIKQVMGSKTMNTQEVYDALKEKNWLPNSSDPKGYVGYKLSSEKKMFERVADKGRGHYRVRGVAVDPPSPPPPGSVGASLLPDFKDVLSNFKGAAVAQGKAETPKKPAKKKPAKKPPVKVEPKEFGEVVKEAREALGLSQRQLGLKVGYKQPHIANIERLRANPSAELTARLKKVLGL